MTFTSLPVKISCKHSSPCVFATAVASFSWLARRKSCYGSVHPQHCCKKPPPCLPLWLHLPFCPVLVLPHLHHIEHARCRLHFQASWLVPPYMASHLSSFSGQNPWDLVSPCSQHPPLSCYHLCISLSFAFCLSVASYGCLVHHFINFLGMSQHVCFCCDAFSSCLVRC